MESKMDGKEENESRKGGNGKRGRGWEETDSQALTKTHTERDRQTARQRDLQSFMLLFCFYFFFIVVCLHACLPIYLSVCLSSYLALSFPSLSRLFLFEFERNFVSFFHSLSPLHISGLFFLPADEYVRRVSAHLLSSAL